MTSPLFPWPKGPALLWLGVTAVLVSGVATTGVELAGATSSSSSTAQPAVTPSPTASSSNNGNQAGGGNNGNGVGNGAGSNPAHPLNVTGTNVTGLAPGVTKQVKVTVTNPNSQAVTVTAVSVTPVNAPTDCAISGDTISPSAPLPAGQSAVFPLNVRMNDNLKSQDSCRNLSFTLNFAATGVQS